MKRIRPYFFLLIISIIMVACVNSYFQNQAKTNQTKTSTPLGSITQRPTHLPIQQPSPHPTQYIPTEKPCEIIKNLLEEDKFIGTIFPPFPCGVKEINDRVQFDKFGKPWLIQIVGVGSHRQLWLAEEVYQNGIRTGKAKLVAGQILPDLNTTKTYMYIPELCARNLVANEEIFVYAEITDEVLISRKITNDLVKKAWILDFEKGEIEEISTGGIICEADYALVDP